MIHLLNSEMESIDGLIRQASVAHAQQSLLRRLEKKVSREELAGYAWLAWRCDLPAAGLKLLAPVVRPPPKSPTRATEVEKAEYAACLLKIGAVDEGDMLLASIDPAKCPSVYFYRSFSLMTRWDYQATVPLLESFLAASGINEYSKLVVRVNLAQALVVERKHSEATNMLVELKRGTSADHKLVAAKVGELLAQNEVLHKNAVAARNHLREVAELHDGKHTLDAFFSVKWEAIAQLVQDGPTPSALEGIALVRAEAEKRQHWETLRECDRFTACALHDEKLYWRLYFGTPYPRYRHWLAHDFGATAPAPENYDWVLRPGKSTALTLQTCLEAENKGTWLLDRLLLLLMSDFYRPFRIASLFQKLYPGEYYNPSSAPAKVHDAVARLRERFQVAGFPLTVVEEKGFYHLFSSKPCLIRVPREAPQSRLDELLRECRAKGEGKPLSPQEICTITGLPMRTVQRLLKSAVETNQATRLGKGRSTRYLFEASENSFQKQSA